MKKALVTLATIIVAAVASPAAVAVAGLVIGLLVALCVMALGTVLLTLTFLVPIIGLLLLIAGAIVVLDKLFS
jgi:hypothetical protein